MSQEHHGKQSTHLLALPALALSCLIGSSPSLAQVQEWTFEIQPYVMNTSLEGDAGVGHVDGDDLTSESTDILEALKSGGMLHAEAIHESGWGVALDYGFMDLNNGVSSSAEGVRDVKLRQGVLQADVMFRTMIGNSTLDYLGGIRWWDSSLELEKTSEDGSIESDVSEEWLDLYVGARWIKPIGQDWHFLLRGDLGGFGLDAEMTSSFSTGIQYQLNEKLSLDLLYKGTWVEYEKESSNKEERYQYDAVTHGPVMGVKFKF
ncbi:hypothetical protein HBA55_30160 [Pseudomaricurvus alkylphenolicus]|jgi:opacity protein-like surface antigen|uniref:hypothetical protein n=1 Tax=Pseudomaricurvus alkylphenolicus TaxID=1306991 RepID=UPI001421AE60|nr:hypothetical protein [Pseudomaricurvus alkylphenolicus]NIB43905.1 hypothetical protein [Pseudomaricurvus alkylphenolicus]